MGARQSHHKEAFTMEKPTEDIVEWLNKHKTGDGDHMKCMKDLVCTFEDKSVRLQHPVDAKWVICDLHGTIYENDEDVVNGWEKFYLPDEVKMQVMGKVTGTSYPCEQLVLMTCSDGKIYGYDGEELHVVASSPEQLCAKGLQDPASLSYYNGQAFKDLTDEDWNKVRQSEVGKSLDRAHDALVNEHKSRFLESLKNGAGEENLKIPESETEKSASAEKKELKPMRPSSGDSSSDYKGVFTMDKMTQDIVEWLNKHKTGGGDHMKCMKDLVCTFEDKSVRLQHPVGAEWVICDLHGTIYENDEDVVNGWEKFYLPDEVKMQVMGKVTGTSYPCEQLVLMTCSDGKIYGYDGEELHVVASSPEQLCAKGLQDPASLSYYNGQAFKDLTDEDWNKVRQSEVGKSLDRAHDALVNEHKSRFLESLKSGASEAKENPKIPESETEKSDRAEKVELKPMRSSSGDSSSESEVRWLMNRLEREIKDYVIEECGPKSSLAHRIRDTLEKLEKELEDSIRSKFGHMLSSSPSSPSSSSSGEPSSDEETTQKWTEKPEKGTWQGLSSRPSSLADVLATKQWADPSRALRVRRIMEQLEREVENNMRDWRRSMSSSTVQRLMERLKEAIKEDVQQKLAPESVSATRGDSSHQTKAVSPEPEVDWLIYQLEDEIKDYMKSGPMSSRHSSSGTIRHSVCY
ncbi:uncharacterized protein LOC141803346 [Halichoeres trimaculatus]|uniref:uncharacterized protein LOC141803346 n=1 Tax=Halichoeres trimaculatus TaxID=147232 RepID=UPI003D9F61BD